jgi:hypothetical protein
MNREMLMLIDAISREKNVERDIVLSAVELALASATKKTLQGRRGHPRGHESGRWFLRDFPPLARRAR